MPNKEITQFPQATSSNLSDIIYAVQGYVNSTNNGSSVYETVQQLLSLIVGGTNISVAFTGGNLVISASGEPGITWNNVTMTSATMSQDNGYVANNSSLVTLTLPTTAAFGSVLYVQGLGGGGWKIAQNVSQQIIVGSSLSTSGSGGYIASSNQYDSISLLCVNANLMFSALGAPQGNITVN